jgi:hypothetical protein
MSRGEAIKRVTATGKRATRSRVAREIRLGGPGSAGGINNAEILFIFSKGSPLHKQPPRPWLEPSIEANKAIIVPHLEAASKAILDQKPQDAERELKRAGTVAANAAKRWPTDGRNGWAPNAPSTIARKGSSRPGIDIGSVRRALTYVLRVAGGKAIAGNLGSQHQYFGKSSSGVAAKAEEIGEEAAGAL